MKPYKKDAEYGKYIHSLRLNFFFFFAIGFKFYLGNSNLV